MRTGSLTSDSMVLTWNKVNSFSDSPVVVKKDLLSLMNDEIQILSKKTKTWIQAAKISLLRKSGFHLRDKRVAPSSRIRAKHF